MANSNVEQLFSGYEDDLRSEVVVWVPVLAGLLVGGVVAVVLCPVPRSQGVTARTALEMALLYVALAAGLALAALLVVDWVAGLMGGPRRVRWAMGPLFEAVVWMTPAVAFSVRKSWWAVAALVVFGMRLARLLRSRTEEEIVDRRRRLWPMAVAAALGQMAVMGWWIGEARGAAGAAGTGVLLVAMRRGDEAQRRRGGWRVAGSTGVAILFVLASFIPYLVVRGEGSGTGGDGRASRVPQRGMVPAEAEVGLVAAFWGMVAGSEPGGARRAEYQAYPALQAIFGDEPPVKVAAKRGRALVAGEAYAGMILRPKVEESVKLVAPPRRGVVVQSKSMARSASPLTIPFEGVYWLYRGSERTLPSDAVELRGDPVDSNFRTTDFTSMVMEARQHFGSAIPLSCCRVIEVEIANGDRRPDTVGLELILRDSRVKRWTSLGVQPVTSTVRWMGREERPPVREVVRFGVPGDMGLTEFDEVAVRFHLRYRSGRSARVAVRSFRLVP